MTTLAYPARTLLLVGGVPGSGKSTLVERVTKREFPHVEIVSADDVRGKVQVKYGEDYHAYNPERIPEARQEFFEELHHAWSCADSIVCEAAYLTEHSRSEMIEWASDRDYYVHLLVVKASLATCLHGVSNRPRSVPDGIVQRYYQQWLNFNIDLRKGRMQKGLAGVTIYERGNVPDEIIFSDWAT